MKKEYEEQLQSELYKSELLRVNILIAIYIITAVSFIILSTFFEDQFVQAQISQTQIHYFYIFITSVLIYENLIKFFFKRLQRQKRKLTQGMQFGNAFEETLIPTISLIIFMKGNNPIIATMSPAVYLYFLFIILSILRINWKISLFTGVSSAIQFIGIIIYAYSHTNLNELPYSLRFEIIYIMKFILMLLAGGAAAFVANEVRKHTVALIKTIEDRNHILKVFGQHVSPQVALELLSNEETTKSKRANVCVMFLDLRNFTSFSESKSPEEVVDFLNVLFEHSIEIVNKYDGIIHQLLGDGFMAIFGAPIPNKNHSQSAASAAMEILHKYQSFKVEKDAISIGIGLHSGEVLTGTVGSKRHKEYKVTGDVVNLASRIETLNKEYNSQLLISKNVWDELNEKPSLIKTYEDIKIRGRQQSVTVYQLK